MKIEKLYTLSQFVDWLFPMELTGEEISLLIYNYNQFLKQPLKKEMFVNEKKEPFGYDGFLKYGSFGLLDSHEVEKCREYLESEKKVIFENVELKSVSTVKHIWINNKKLSYGVKTGKYFYHLTLTELAEATNGALEFKGVEL